MKLTIFSNKNANVQKNDEERLSPHPARLPAPKISFLIALVVIALVCLVSSCSEPDVEIIEPPKQPPPMVLPDSIHIDNIFFSNAQTGWLSVGILKRSIKYKGGVFKTIDGGINWYAVLLSEKTNIRMVRFTDCDHGWALGEKAQLFSTSDGGITWDQYDTRKFLGDEDTLYMFIKMYFLNSLEGWIVGSRKGSPIDCGGYGYLFHTTNGGIDWSIDFATTDASLTDITILPDGKGWLTGGGHYVSCTPFILHTSDKGGNWLRQNVDPSIHGLVYNVNFRNDVYGFTYGFLGILRTTNGGIQWDTTGTSLGSVYELSIANDSIVYALRSQPFAVYKSVDIGRVWSNTLQTTDILTTIYFLNDSTGWVAGTETYPSRTLVLYQYRSNVWAKIR